MMEQEELKRKLMGLWERATHSSKELLSILFEYYFDINYLEYKESDGKVVSALFGIPYTFGSGEKNLKGLYLISLSLEEGFRKKGILSELFHNFNQRMKEEFDFTFIVPHTELLADYYGTQGYFSSFFIIEERFTPHHDFKKDYFLSLTDSDERIKDLKKGLFGEIKVVDQKTEPVFSNDQIIKFIESIENKSISSVNLTHTRRDLDYIILDDSLRNLGCFVSYDSDGRITGVSFTQKEDIKRTKIVASYVSDLCSYYVLLDFIKHHFSDHSLSIITSDPKYQSHSIIQQTYASENPAGGDLDNTFGTIEISFNVNKLLQPLGMVRLLRFENIITYLSMTRSDVEFKLHIRDYNIEEIPAKLKTVFVVRNGKCKIEKYDELPHDKSILSLSIKEISELLLRKNDTSNLIMEAFGIPRLNLQMRLLPF